MAVAFRSSSDALSSGTNITAVEPTGAASGDLLLAIIIAGEAATLGLPAGWTSRHAGASSTPLFDYIIGWIFRGASAPDLTFTVSSSVFRQVTIGAFTGVDTTTPISGSDVALAAASQTPDPPSVATGLTDGMAVAMAASWTGANPFVPPAGYTLRGNTGNTDVGYATKALAGDGAEDPATFTGPGTPSNVLAATVLLAPVGAAPPAAGVVQHIRQRVGVWQPDVPTT